MRPAFDQFIAGLRGNLNESITETDAIEMLSQHLITRPVFDALFGGYDFAEHNPVAQSMEEMLTVLDEHALDDENHTLEKFYDSVRMKVAGLDTTEGRQKIIVRLYDTFFATAFKKTVDKLGIVYTPIEIVDFILRSADWALREHFGQGLTDEGVHILDGFVGTGTFIVRLIQSGLITPHDLARKYATELHANEILLLAYYIAAVNIETAYQDAMAEAGQPVAYAPFPGLVLTDTFQSYEDGDTQDALLLVENNERLERQKKLPITVIVGNPPYSSGQDSANDNNQNTSYPGLDQSIRDAYSSERGRGGNNSLYDSYIRAIRWSTLRVGHRGVIAFVTNGGWIDSNVGAEMRQTLEREFKAIHLFSLRGNGRVAGAAGRAEGRPVFEFAGWGPGGVERKSSKGGSRATIAIALFVRDSTTSGETLITYDQVADGLSAGEKLRAVARHASMAGLPSRRVIHPNAAGDWVTQRGEEFDTYLPMGVKHGARLGSTTIFQLYGRGLETGRDAWVYRFSALHTCGGGGVSPPPMRSMRSR